MYFKEILLALSGKDDESNVISTAIKLTRQLDTKLSVIHVRDPRAGKPHMLMETLPLIEEKDIREDFEDAGYKEEGESVPVDILEGESYQEEISKATAEADLLIIGHSHKSRFLQALSNTLDEKIANTAKCPVVVVPKWE